MAQYMYLLANSQWNHFQMNKTNLPATVLKENIKQKIGSAFSLYIVTGDNILSFGEYLHQQIINNHLHDDNYQLRSYPKVMDLIGHNMHLIPNFKMEYLFPEENSMEWVPITF